MDSTLPLGTALELEMSPHLASFDKRKARKVGRVAGSWVDAEPVVPSNLVEEERALGVESRPWKRHAVIGAIIGSEIAVIMGLFANLARGSTHPRQSAWILGILSLALFVLSRMRRKALPAASECSTFNP